MRDRFCISLCAIVLGLLLSPPLSHAQNLGGELSQIGEMYADGYVAPLTDALGADLNGGLFRSADVGDGFIPGLPVNVYLGVSASGALIPASKKEFTFDQESFDAQFTTQGGQTGERSVVVSAENTRNGQVPTIFGDTDPAGRLIFTDESTGNQIQEYDVPPGLVDTPIAPLPVPQVGIGAVMGTDVQVRYLPKISYSNYGNVGLKGLAVRHDIDQYLPGPTPLSLAVQGAWNELAIESDGSEVLNASGWAVNVQASKSLPVAPITFYGGLQYEDFSTDYTYTFQVSGNGNGEREFSISQDASNSVRGLAGVTLTLAIIQINVDYALSQTNTLTAGVGLQL